ncbi:DUF3822 family protein [Taibaiella koreensis]|uniref:DUF3822 family protein n=1 Tax=Taibaiella koreensis TaxID=1268548 RepID=UPI000E59BD5A|nr:DUF3822 family protein [Taibaiella koreensis]
MSLIKHEILQPVRHFNMHDDPLTNIETLHLIVWDKGLCIAGYGRDSNVLTTKVYHYASWNMAAIESIFVNEPLVAGPQLVTHIWIADERSQIIPQPLFEKEAAASWLRRFYFIEAGEQVRATPVSRVLPATISYPAPEKLVQLAQKYFAEGRIEALSATILCQEMTPEQYYADLVFLDAKVLLTVSSNGRLLLHQVMEMDHVNNLLYRIALICREHDLQQEELRVSVSGLCLSEAVLDELRHFFPRITVPGTEQFASFTLLSKLISCAS